MIKQAIQVISMCSISPSRTVYRLRRLVAWAMVPVAFLAGWPVSAGCVCSDGHYEPVCKADLCRLGIGECGCLCCAKDAIASSADSCSKDDPCCISEHSGNPVQDSCDTQARANGCCTPIVHQTVATADTLPLLADVYQFPAEMLPAALVPWSYAASSKVFHGVDFDTGPTPVDLVITLRRLVI
jgi:hypothetical protein